MIACPACATESPDGFRFCPACANPLWTAVAAPPAEERKIVTALFCDLVGFTATSEAADPEDIDRMLSAYFGLARSQIEMHGGVVEKFIGDAVLGVFGVPAAHEDDPERGVRAALRICEDAERLQTPGGAPLRLRVGINTGEALVRLSVQPGSGERFLAGDAINTASRIQSVAPEMGVAVGLGTYEATRAAFDYAELEPASLKGKAQPVRVFHAIAPRARLGVDLTRTHDSPYVGREIDLALLKGQFDKTVAAASVQLVTIVGEPGLGKSRIVAELGAYVDGRADLVTWRQGRCLPYGEGITFWALGEVVKGHAGILDSDTVEVASGKLDAVLPEGPERAWFRQRLLPLLGIEAGASAEREEQFTAWRRFLEHVAEDGPTVLVFEDLHWADDAMLAFLEHLADRAGGVPLLVIGTARPELHERHPDFAARLRNANRINLDPLTPGETARLVAALLDTTVLPAELAGPILERAEGNPLYAEEFVRLLRDRGLVVETAEGWQLGANAEVPLPDTIGALIAARLDTLSPERKSMLADAAVVGKVFWAGAVAAMGDRDVMDVDEAMRELARKELVRPARHSSMAGETEYAFWHVLARDVAYAQQTRASRAVRHVAAATWIESKAADRIEDVADVLSYHYSTALELARAVGQSADAERLEEPTLRFLSLAGDRALGLDAAVAIAAFERALALTPPGHPARPDALIRFGVAASQRGRHAEARAALNEGAEAFVARGDPAAAVRGLEDLVVSLGHLGDPREWTAPLELLAVVEPLGPSPELAQVLGEVAANEAMQGRSAQAIVTADRALALAEELGLVRPARAVGFRGLARGNLGDPGGLLDLREAIQLASQAGQGRSVATYHNNLAVSLWGFEGPAASLEAIEDGIRYAESRGITGMSQSMRCGSVDPILESGAFDRVLEIVAEEAVRLETAGDRSDLAVVRAAQSRIAVVRGSAADAKSWLPSFVEAAREIASPDFATCLGAAAGLHLLLGRPSQAATLLDEVERSPDVRTSVNYPAFLPMMVRTANAVGDVALGQRLIAGVEPTYPLAEHALVAARATLEEAGGNLQAAADTYSDAADRWDRFGVVPERAFALLGHGRCLVGLGRPTEAAPVLRQAREIFQRLRAVPALAEADALLEDSSSGPANTP